MKSLLKFITCGSVDDGKSTLIGHMLYDAKLIFADQKKAMTVSLITRFFLTDLWQSVSRELL